MFSCSPLVSRLRTDGQGLKSVSPPQFSVSSTLIFCQCPSPLSFSSPSFHSHLVSHISFIQSITLFSLYLLVPPVSISFSLSPLSFLFSPSLLSPSQTLTSPSFSSSAFSHSSLNYISPSVPYTSLIQSLSPALIQSLTFLSLAFIHFLGPLHLSHSAPQSLSHSVPDIFLSRSHLVPQSLTPLSFSPSVPYTSLALIQSLSPLHLSHSVPQSLTPLSLSFSP